MTNLIAINAKNYVIKPHSITSNELNTKIFLKSKETTTQIQLPVVKSEMDVRTSFIEIYFIHHFVESGNLRLFKI